MARDRRRRPASTRLLRTRQIGMLPSRAFSSLDSPSFRLERLTADKSLESHATVAAAFLKVSILGNLKFWLKCSDAPTVPTIFVAPELSALSVHGRNQINNLKSLSASGCKVLVALSGSTLYFWSWSI